MSDNFVQAIQTADIAPGGMKAVEVGGRHGTDAHRKRGERARGRLREAAPAVVEEEPRL